MPRTIGNAVTTAVGATAEAIVPRAMRRSHSAPRLAQAHGEGPAITPDEVRAIMNMHPRNVDGTHQSWIPAGTKRQAITAPTPPDADYIESPTARRPGEYLQLPPGHASVPPPYPGQEIHAQYAMDNDWTKPHAQQAARSSFVVQAMKRSRGSEDLERDAGGTWLRNVQKDLSEVNVQLPRTNHCYHSQVCLKDGRLGLVADIGSRGNLCGEEWVKEALKTAQRNAHKAKVKPREKPMSVAGVGKEAQDCKNDVAVGGAIPFTEETDAMKVLYKAPIIPNSDCPALLGLESLRDLRALIDCRTNDIHFLGQDDRPLQLPEGTRTVRSELSSTGHLMIPFDSYCELPQHKNVKEVALNVTRKDAKDDPLDENPWKDYNPEIDPNPHITRILAAKGVSAMSAEEMSDLVQKHQKKWNPEDGLLYSPASPEYDAIADK